jgi:hypothetical protein
VRGATKAANYWVWLAVIATLGVLLAGLAIFLPAVI